MHHRGTKAQEDAQRIDGMRSVHLLGMKAKGYPLAALGPYWSSHLSFCLLEEVQLLVEGLVTLYHIRNLVGALYKFRFFRER